MNRILFKWGFSVQQNLISFNQKLNTSQKSMNHLNLDQITTGFNNQMQLRRLKSVYFIRKNFNDALSNGIFYSNTVDAKTQRKHIINGCEQFKLVLIN